MKVLAGTVLTDSVSGLKLMVVEEPATSDVHITADGRELVAVSIVPAVPPLRGHLTTDPGVRGG